MFRLTTAALATATFIVGSGLTAGAAPAQHEVFQEDYDGYEHVSALENPCGVWGATFHEVRSGEYRVLTAPGGQVNGEYHFNGAIDGWVELVPDDPALPTYTGSYREKVNGVAIGFDEEEGDLTRVDQYRLRVRLTGTNGSTLVLAMSGKTTLNANGDVVVSRDQMDCS